jgi:ankyrin repeat protein
MRSVFIRNSDEPLTDFVLDIDLIISLVKKRLAYDFLHSSSNIFDCGCLLFYMYENQSYCHSITFLKRHNKDLEVCVPVIACIINMIKKSTNKEEKEFYTSNLFALLKRALNETKNWELVKYCLREHSKPIVSLKSKDQRILLHLISANKPAYDVFKMALDLGIKYKVGGKDGKGGLLVKNTDGETPLQLLSEQNAGAVNKIYNYISNFKEQSLIDKSVYKKFDLLHHVAGSGKESVARKFLEANPKLVSMVDENGQLPLHHACKRSASIEQRKMIKLLAQSGSKQKLTGKSGLLLADDQDVTPLENLVSFHPLTDKVYDVLFEVFDDVPVLQTAIESGCTNHINDFCMKNKQCLAVRDEWGCLPIHTCADLKGPPEDLPEKTELLKCIISHDPQALCERNGETGVFPFQSIASNEFYCLSLLYDVIRMEPSIVNSG